MGMFQQKQMRKEYNSFFERHRFWIATSTLVGTTIGAGILGIPYVVAKAGVLYGFFLIILFGLAFMFLNLALGEVVLRTKGIHQLTGYAEAYLGFLGKIVMALALMISIYGALSAYVIGEGIALYSLFSDSNMVSYFGLSPVVFSVLFFVVAGTVVLLGLKATGRLELLLVGLLVMVVVFMGGVSFSSLNFSAFLWFDFSSGWLVFFLPWGVIMFAFMGAPAIAVMREELGSRTQVLKRAIMIGTLIPLLVYLLFTIVVVGIVGVDTLSNLGPDSRMATVALSLYSNPIFSVLATVISILAMFTSFLNLSHALLAMYERDFGVERKVAVLCVWIIPLVVLFAGLGSFVSIIGWAGALAGGVQGLLILCLFYFAKKKGKRIPEYSMQFRWSVVAILGLVFLVSVASVFW